MPKNKNEPLFLIFVMVLLISGCAEFHKPSPSGVSISPLQMENKPPATVMVQALSHTIPSSSSIRKTIPTGRVVLEAMYGDEALSMNDKEAIIPAQVPNQTAIVHINLMTCFWESLEEKCLVVTDKSFDNCHVCQAEIDSAIFQRMHDSWELTVFQPNVIALGSFGYVPKGELIQIGPDKHAALVKSSWNGQGYEGEYNTIIAETNDSIQVVFNLLISEIEESLEKDGTTSLKWGYSSKMEFFPGARSDYYDLKVTQFGVNKEGMKFKHVRFYTFSDTEGRYMMVSHQ